jgi:hypothetical protein
MSSSGRTADAPRLGLGANAAQFTLLLVVNETHSLEVTGVGLLGVRPFAVFLRGRL